MYDPKLFHTEQIIEVYPHTTDFLEDQSNCDEFDMILIPVHAERWRNRRDKISERDRNREVLSQGQEALDFLNRKVHLTPDQKRALIVALANELIPDGGLGDLLPVVEALHDNSMEGSDEWYPDEVPGITDGGYHQPEDLSIFPTKWDPLPDISGHMRIQLGYSESGIRVPTNTDLDDVEIIPTTRSISMEEFRKNHPHWDDHRII